MGFREEGDWVSDVRLMARRLALFYHFVAQTLIEELGEEKAEDLIKRAIWSYGTHIGEVKRDQALEKGLGLACANLVRIPDLPSKGWEFKSLEMLSEDEMQAEATLCPIAKVFLEMKTPLARLYCLVDQAQTEGFNPELECVHEQNVLDGDEVCKLVFKKKDN